MVFMYGVLSEYGSCTPSRRAAPISVSSRNSARSTPRAATTDLSASSHSRVSSGSRSWRISISPLLFSPDDAVLRRLRMRGNLTRCGDHAALPRPRGQQRRAASGDELALGCCGARVHVLAAVQVGVYLGGAAEHAPEKKKGKSGSSQRPLRSRAAAVRLPQNLEQQGRNNRVDVDAVHVARDACVVECLHQRAIILVKHVVLAPLRVQLAEEYLARIVIDRLVLEYRMIDARNLAPAAGTAGGGLGVRVFGSVTRRHRLEVQPVLGLCRI